MYNGTFPVACNFLITYCSRNYDCFSHSINKNDLINRSSIRAANFISYRQFVKLCFCNLLFIAKSL